MKKIIWIIIILLIIWGVVALVGDKNELRKDNAFRVGVIAPLTGNFGVLGERVKNGFEMAKADLIKNEVIDDIDIIYEDVCQPKGAVSAVQKLINIDEIDILGGSFCVVGFVPSIPILEEAEIVYFNTAPNPDSVIGKKHLISTNSSIQEKGQQIAKFAYDKLNGRTASIIYYNTPLGVDYNKYLSETFEKSGGKILSSEITLVDATDFRTQLTKIKQLKPDILFVVQLANPLGNLLKQADELDVDSVIVGNSSNEDPSIISTAGLSAEGFVIASDEPFPKNEKINDFAIRYSELYGQDADVFAANAYDALTLQVTVFNKCGDDNACMLEELHNIKDFEGVSGNITIKDDGTAEKPTIFKIIKDGEFVRYEE